MSGSQLSVLSSQKQRDSKKVDFFFIEEDGPEGRRVGVQCSACPARFFDRTSKGKHPRVLESGVSLAIDHANTVHLSSGGVFRPRAAIQ